MMATRRQKSLFAAAVALVVSGVLLAILLVGGSSGFRHGDPFDPFPQSGPRGSATAVGGAPDVRKELTQFLPFGPGRR